MAGPQHITIERIDDVAVVTIDRPPANALTVRVYDELSGAFDSAGRPDSGYRAVVLTAAGKYFCVGKDLKAKSHASEEERSLAVRTAFSAIRNCALPVVAALNGAALGAGLTFVFSCDLVVASQTAVFGLPEIDAGLAGGFAIMRRGLNQFQARRLYLTGEHLTAAELYRLGVVMKVVEPDALMDESMQVARVLASKSPIAMRTAKWSANEVEKLVDFEQAHRIVESRLTIALADTYDHKEAAAAFREGRSPRFLGR